MQRRCIALLLALCALSLSSAVRGQVNQESVRVIAGERESGTLSPLLPTIHKVALAFKPGASAAAWGQRVALEGTVQDIATSKVHGIKIVSSSLDSKTHSGTVTFQNDSKKEIQAVQGEVTVTHVNGRVAMARALWASWDDVYRAARMKVRPNDPASKMWVNRVARGPLNQERASLRILVTALPMARAKKLPVSPCSMSLLSILTIPQSPSMTKCCTAISITA